MAGRPQAMLIDMDNTILVYDGVAAPTWQRLCDEYADGLGVSVDALFAAIDAKQKWFWSDTERFRTGRQDLIGSRRTVMGLAFEALGLKASETADEIADRYNDEREASMHPFDGALEALDAFHQAGVRLGMMTNGAGARQRAKIERFNLARYFDLILIEGEMGFGKPDSRVYARALDELDADPASTWAVGDGLEWDVGGPQAHGIYGVWIDWKDQGLPASSPTQPDRIVNGLRDLVPDVVGG